MPKTKFMELHQATRKIAKVLEALTATEREQVIKAALALTEGSKDGD